MFLVFGGLRQPNWVGAGGNVDGGLVEEGERKEGRLLVWFDGSGEGSLNRLDEGADGCRQRHGGGGATGG